MVGQANKERAPYTNFGSLLLAEGQPALITAANWAKG
jgi:hypothetical protein